MIINDTFTDEKLVVFLLRFNTNDNGIILTN